MRKVNRSNNNNKYLLILLSLTGFCLLTMGIGYSLLSVDNHININVNKVTPSTLTTTTNSSSQYLGHALTKSSVETITINNTNEVPANALESWDASSAGNGSVMVYYLDSDSNGKYELYIGGTDGVQSNSNSRYLFSRFNYVTSITGLNNLYTDGVTNMSNMFFGCISLTSLDLSNFNTSSVGNMSYMFSSCSSLTSLDLSNFNTSSVTTMERMFENCTALTSLDLSSFNTSSVTEMSYMFQSCIKLTTTIDITTTSATYSSMFDNAATQSGAQITVNYTSANSSLVDSMIATKLSDSNVVKGSLIS